MSKCQHKINNLSDKVECAISGSIDESFPPDLPEQVPSDKDLIVDLAEVKSINSLGIRAWIKFTRALKNNNIHFINCPKIFIDQLNIIQDFIPPQSKVISFYVPYFNEETETEKVFLFTCDKDYSNTFNNIPTTIPDPSGGTFTMDVIGSRYFKFIKPM